VLSSLQARCTGAGAHICGSCSLRRVKHPSLCITGSMSCSARMRSCWLLARRRLLHVAEQRARRGLKPPL